MAIEMKQDKFDLKIGVLSDYLQARPKEEIKNIRNKNGLINYKKFMGLIKSNEREISSELVRKYFLVQNLGDLLKNLKKLKNNPVENKRLVNLIKSGLSDFKNEIKKMSEEEKRIENPYEIVNVVENMLEFNGQQQGQGLIKILTLRHMLSRLPISLAYLKAKNNTEKLQNEIR